MIGKLNAANLSIPHPRSMPSIGKRCRERRNRDAKVTWHIIYRIDEDAILILEVFAKKTNKAPKKVIKNVRNG